jgi:holin-like protein
VHTVARFLLAHLSLLFVPVGVGVISQLGLLAEHGVRLLVVIVVSTWVGMAVTALVLRRLMRGNPRPEGTE